MSRRRAWTPHPGAECGGYWSGQRQGERSSSPHTTWVSRRAYCHSNRLCVSMQECECSRGVSAFVSVCYEFDCNEHLQFAFAVRMFFWHRMAHVIVDFVHDICIVTFFLQMRRTCCVTACPSSLTAKCGAWARNITSKRNLAAATLSRCVYRSRSLALPPSLATPLCRRCR